MKSNSLRNCTSGMMKTRKKVATQTKIQKDTWSTEFLYAQLKDTENKRGLLHAKQVCTLCTERI